MKNFKQLPASVKPQVRHFLPKQHHISFSITPYQSKELLEDLGVTGSK